MPLWFKMQKTLVCFSHNAWYSKTFKGSCYLRTFEKCRELRKIKIHMWNVSVLSCYGPSFHHQRHEKERVQVPQQNEMVSLDCATLGFISKNEVYKLENNR